MNKLPKNLIGHDLRRWQDQNYIERLIREEREESRLMAKKFATAALIIAVYLILVNI